MFTKYINLFTDFGFIEKGIEQGIEKGSQESKLEIARNLKKLGLSIENISQATGLSQTEIENLN